MAKIKKLKLGTELYDIEPTNTVPLSDVAVTSVAGKKGDVTLSKSDVGLGNVGNFKAVSTAASQGLTSTEQANARANIGAGTSSLTLGTTSTTAAKGDHTHTTTIAASSGTNELTLAHGTKYAITAGGDSFVFTMPSSGNTHNSHAIISGTKSDGSTQIKGSASSGDITLGDSGVTAGTYRSVTVNSKGIVVAGSSTDTDTNTWRKVQLNGTDKLGTGTNTNPLNIKAGKDMSITESGGTFTFNSETNFESIGTYSELGALKTTIAGGSYTRSQAFKCIIGTDYYYGFLNVVKNSSGTITSYDIIMWKGAAIYYLTYTVSNSTWTENTKYLSTTDHTHSGYAASDHTHGYIEGASNGLSIDHQVGSTKKVQANLKNNTKSSYAATYNAPTSADSSRFCAVSLDSSGYLAVNVPWNSGITSHQTIKQDGITGATVNRFGTCSTAASSAAKTVSITTGTFSLEAGARVTVKFTNANTASTPTLNVASKGAKNIFHKGAQITSGTNKSLLAGTVDFVYDGTQWHLVGNYIDSNTTYSGATQSSAGLMSPADKIKVDALGTAANKGVDDSISAGSTSTNLPTSKAVAAFVEGKGYKTTDNNTTYTFATGDSNGQIKVTPSGGTAQNVSVKGLGSAAYTNSSEYAAASHGTHVTAATVKSALGTGTGTSKYLREDGTWVTPPNSNTDAIYSGIAYCTTAASTAAKVATMPKFALASGQYILLRTTIANTATSSVTLNVNSTGAKTIKIGSAAVTASNFPAGDYLAKYDGTNWVLTRVYLTDTTYSSKTAASGGTDVSLVTTGEKYTWNAAAQAANTKITPTAGQGLIYKDTVEGNTTTREIRANLLSSTNMAVDAVGGLTATSDRVYPVEIDKSGYLAVYVPLDADLTAIAGLTGTAGVLRKTNTNTWSLDTTAYLTNASAIPAQQINAMTGYIKPSSTSAISTSDSLNSAIGKLEKALDSKGTSNLTLGGNGSATTAAKSDHTHDNYITGLKVEEMIGSYDSSISGVFAPATHTHNYAGSSSAGGAANSVKTSLTFNNGGSGAASGTTFNGSTARTISYNTVGAAPATHGHFVSVSSYPEIGALKYDITAGNVTTTSCWIAGYVSNIYSFGHVAKTGTNSYILFLWMGDVLHRSIYNGSSWTDDTRTYTQSNKLPSFSLSGTVLTITDNN